MSYHNADTTGTADSPEQSASKPAPYLIDRNHPGLSDEAGRDWIIPTILVLVTIVVISSTFFDEELAKLRTAANLSISGNEVDKRMENDTNRSAAISAPPLANVRAKANDVVQAMLQANNHTHLATTTTHTPDSLQDPAAVRNPGSASTHEPRISPERDPGRESRESMYRHRVALRAATLARMQQDRRDMLRRMLEIQRDVQRARAASLMRMYRAPRHPPNSYLM